MKKRTFLLSAATLALAGSFSAHAQTTPIKFQLDWRFEGPAALFLQPAAKVVQGFPPVMPPYAGTLNDRQIDAIIAFMKSDRLH